MPDSKIPSILMTIIWVALGIKVVDVLYRFAKSLCAGFEGVSGFLKSEFGNLSTLVLLASIVYLVRKQGNSQAA